MASASVLVWTLFTLTHCGVYSSLVEISQVHKIYVDPENGRDTPACINSDDMEFRCKSLHFAFNYSNDSTAYILQPSEYFLEEEISFVNLVDISFIGNSSEVFCFGQGVGLEFVNVTNIAFSSITFRNCGAVRNSTSKNFKLNSLSKFNVSLYFFICRNVVMNFVTVSDSTDATGVVMYDTDGVNLITNSNFSNNSVTGLVSGGGGFYIEFTYCNPGEQNCTDNESPDNQHNGRSKYTFDNVMFADNVASNEGLTSNSTYIIGYKSNHQSFGRGGGLSLYMKGNAKHNHFTFVNCKFRNNRAQWGAGAFIEFHDKTMNNSITFSNCEFSRNRCNFTFDSGTGGGGMRVGHYVFSFENSSDGSLYRNQVDFVECNFTNNSAMYGGGLSISPALGTVFRCFGARPAHISVSDGLYQSNVAKFGSALHISRYPFSIAGDMPQIIVSNTTFVENSCQYAKMLYNADEPHIPHTEGIGAVYINQVDVMFRGSILFLNNVETALAVAGSRLDFRLCDLKFEGNEGYMGGALTLLGSSYVIIDDSTMMSFSSNIAKLNGGAMYIRYIEMDNLKTSFNCFIRHDNPLLHPDDWQANFTFFNNTDRYGQHSNSIHTTSVLPCAWAGGNGYAINTSEIFCWTAWKYYDNLGQFIQCSDQITTEPGEIALLSAKNSIEVVPGLYFELPIRVSDDYQNNLTDITVFRSAYNGSDNAVSSGYFWGGRGSLVGNEDSIVKLTLKTLGDVIWRSELTVNLVQCPPGLYRSNDSSSTECICINDEMYQGKLSCDPLSHKVSMKDQNWFGYVKGEYVVGLCPPGFCRRGDDSRISLPTSPNELDESVCEANRTGVLCGSCVDDYGPAINSYKFDCLPCENTTNSVSANVFKYIASVYIPLALLFVFLILFDIRLTTGPANAFILYSQMVTTTFALNAYGQIPFNQITDNTYSTLEKIFVVIYGIFNLEFIENLLPLFCLTSEFNVLNVLILDYLVASVPLMMIILAILSLKLKECCFSRCVRVSNVIKKSSCCKTRNVTQALLPAFASFLLLSYHKFSLTSSYILSVQPLVDRNGKEQSPERVYFAGDLVPTNPNYHNTFYLPAVIVTVIIVIFPVLLLGYPLMLFEWCLSKIKVFKKIYPADKIHFFLDTFHGCYKIKMRFFAGLYFLFRLAINTVYVLSSTWITQFVLQQLACIVMIALVAVFQPYREKYLNYVDALIFANLAILNSLSLYLYVASQDIQSSHKVAFAIQYIFALLPLFYMIGFVIYYFCTSENCIKRRLGSLVSSSLERRQILKRMVRAESDGGSDHASREWISQSADEQLFARACDSNRYSRVSSSPGKSIQVDSSESFGSTPSGTASSSSLRQSTEDTKYGTMNTGLSKSSAST